MSIHAGPLVNCYPSSFIPYYSSPVKFSGSAGTDLQLHEAGKRPTVKGAKGVLDDFRPFKQDKDECDRIPVRISLHLGDGPIIGEDVIGNGVKVAARIETLAEPGGYDSSMMLGILRFV